MAATQALADPYGNKFYEKEVKGWYDKRAEPDERGRYDRVFGTLPGDKEQDTASTSDVGPRPTTARPSTARPGTARPGTATARPTVVTGGLGEAGRHKPCRHALQVMCILHVMLHVACEIMPCMHINSCAHACIPIVTWTVVVDSHCVSAQQAPSQCFFWMLSC